jgi:LemA protein
VTAYAVAQAHPPSGLAIPLAVLGAAAVAGLGWVAWTFNRLVRARNKLREARAGIDVQLKRRRDLVPALVAAVAAYRDHERDLITAVTRHRTEAESARSASPAEAAGAENALAADLGRLVALAEAYPALKADQAFRDLGVQLVALEDDLQFARRYFNGAARDLNNLAATFPTLVVARAFGFGHADYFEVESASDRLPPDLRRELRP